MFDELLKYNQKDHFKFKPQENLGLTCNAPINKSGIYILYSLKNGEIELIYIGRSGKIDKQGKMFIRKTGLGGLKDRIVNGHQFGKTPRRISWPTQMKKENIEALDIYWYATHNDIYNDCPRILENKLLKIYFELFGRLPRWNNEL